MFVHDVRVSPNDLGDAQSIAVFDAAFDECDSRYCVGGRFGFGWGCETHQFK